MLFPHQGFDKFDWCDFQELSMPDGKHLLRRTGSFLKLKHLQKLSRTCLNYYTLALCNYKLLESNSESTEEGHARFHAVPQNCSKKLWAVRCRQKSLFQYLVWAWQFRRASRGHSCGFQITCYALSEFPIECMLTNDQLRTEYWTFHCRGEVLVLEHFCLGMS